MLVSSRRPRAERKNALFAPARELGPRFAEVAGEPVLRLLAERHDAVLAALAVADVDELLLEVDVAEVETDRLGAAQAGGVDELDERAVAERDRAVAFERGEQLLDLGGRGGVGQAPRAAGGEPSVRHALRAERMAEEGAHGGELPRDRRRRELPRPPIAERRDVVGEDADVDLLERDPVLLEPVAELADVAAVGAARALAERRRGEEAVGCGTEVQSRQFDARVARLCASVVLVIGSTTCSSSGPAAQACAPRSRRSTPAPTSR